MYLVYFRNILEETPFINVHNNPSKTADFLHNDRQTERRCEADSQFS